MPGQAVGQHRRRRASSADAWSLDDVQRVHHQAPTSGSRPTSQPAAPVRDGGEGESLHAHLKLAWPWVLALLEDARWLAADAQVQQIEQSTGVLRKELPHVLQACGQSSASDVESALDSLQAMIEGMDNFETALSDTHGYHQSSQKPLQVLSASFFVSFLFPTGSSEVATGVPGRTSHHQKLARATLTDTTAAPSAVCS